jgi:Xaa-Pro dipeptidase
MNLSDRSDAVRKLMAAEGVDLLLAFSNGLHAIQAPDPVFHLSGYRPRDESALLLAADDAHLIATPAAEEERVRLRSAVTNCVAVKDLSAALGHFLPAPGMSLATVGLAGLRHDVVTRIDALLGKQAKRLDDPFHAATAWKTEEEIGFARRAAWIAEEGFAHLLEIARPGMKECDLAVALKLHMEALGADDNFLLLSALPHNKNVRPSSDRRLEPGDVVLAELTPTYRGQFAQICRTASIGAPSPVLAQKYALVVDAMQAGIRAVRPGATVADVCGAIDAVLTEAGYGELCRPPHMRRRGHGLGFGSTVPGDVAIDNHWRLEPDMIFVVHPNQYLPETGYLLCGEPVRITASGVEVLSSRLAALGVAAG